MRYFAITLTSLALATLSSAVRCGCKSATLTTHNETFRPDEVLRVTLEMASIAGAQRESALVNGTFPGPALKFKEGETKWIRVYNDMESQNLTMHWHGLSQAAFPFSDGTPMASQWPIPPKHFFDYQVRFPENHAGTYFYHSHVGFQAITAAGGLTIEESDGKPPYQYDDERTLLLGDFYNKTDEAMERDLKASPFIFGGETQALLVNGKGVSSFPTPGAEKSMGPAVIDVEPGKTYRLRWIGGTAISFVSAGIQSHSDLSVIEADGDYTKPVSTSFMQVGPGQRFSTLLKSKSCEELMAEKTSQFYLQIESRERANAANTTGYAILQYKTDSCTGMDIPKPLSSTEYPKQKPMSLPPVDREFLEYKLAPIRENNFPKASEVTRRVIMSSHQFVNAFTTWAENNVSWYETNANIPNTPYLVSLYQNATKFLPDWNRAMANNGVDPVTAAFPAKLGEVLEIVLQNTGSDSSGLDIHPFHLHGEHYWDIGSGNGTYNAEENEKVIANTQPIRRDTTMLYKYGEKTTPGINAGWRAWRVRITDPGVYMLHCHILQHSIMSMNSAWVFGDANDILKVPKPMVEGYLTFGGSVMGNANRWPTVVDFEPPGDLL